MKRKIILTLVAICSIICAIVGLSACNRKNTDTSNDNISRQTYSYYAGESELFAVTIEFGKREKTFIADGKATDVCDFVELIIVPLKKNECEKISYIIAGQDATLSGEVASSNYGEFVSALQLDFIPSTVTVTAGEDSSEIEMCNILEGALSSLDVVNIAKTEFKDRIESETAQGKNDREIYVKIISGDRINYYYYVSFIGEGVDYWAMLIDIKTGDIVSKK